MHDARSAAFPLQLHAHLLSQNDTPDAAEIAAEIKAYLVQFSALMQTLGRCADVMSGGATPRFAPTDLEQVARTAIRRIEEQGTAAGRIELRVTSEMPPVQADFERLVDAVDELLRNALDAGPTDQSIVIELAATADQALVRVRDAGPGIPVEYRELVTAPWFRMQPKYEPVAGRAGLGLALVLQSIEAHRGTLRVENAREGGCEVTLVIPLATAVD